MNHYFIHFQLHFNKDFLLIQNHFFFKFLNIACMLFFFRGIIIVYRKYSTDSFKLFFRIFCKKISPSRIRSFYFLWCALSRSRSRWMQIYPMSSSSRTKGKFEIYLSHHEVLSTCKLFHIIMYVNTNLCKNMCISGSDPALRFYQFNMNQEKQKIKNVLTWKNKNNNNSK